MKNFTRILALIAFILFTTEVVAQKECAVICTKGNLIKAVGGPSIKAHLNNGGTLISTDCDYVVTGEECQSLSLPKLDFKQEIPLNLKFTIFDTVGRILIKGITTETLYNQIPPGQILFLEVEGYRIKKLYKN